MVLEAWDAGTFTAKFHWTAASGSGNVIWGIQAVTLRDNDAIDTAWGSAVEVTDTLQSALYEHISAASAACTAGGTRAAGNIVQFRVYRKAADGGDTLTTASLLLGVSISYTTA
jgi:hypothetical protein